ncbi:hypothetical protein C1646_820311, partial [Rhizophagus diaphanus]
MSKVIKIEVDDVDKIEIDDVDKIDFDKINVNENDVDKIFTFDDEQHNGKPITMLEISSNEKYLITYSEEDRSIIGWNVEDIDKAQLKFHQTVKTKKDDKDYKYEVKSLCVSDDKKLAYITRHYRKHSDYTTCTVIDMNNKVKKITLNFETIWAYYCTFNLKGEFIKYSEFDDKTIWIYSTQTKNNKWECRRLYRIPENYELISISKYNKVYLFSNDYIYEWNINTERGVKIFDNNKDKDENKGNNKDNNKFETKNIGIFSNEKLIFLKINDKIIVYSIELGIPIVSLDINNDEEIKYCWNNKYKSWINQTLFDGPTNKKTKFVLMFGRVWKSNFDEKMSKTNFSSKNSDDLNKKNNKIVECDEYLNVHSFNLYMDTVSTLFQKVITREKELYVQTLSIKLAVNLIEWDISVGDGKIKLEVFKKEKLVSTRIENFHYPIKVSGCTLHDHELIVSSLFSNNDIIILTSFGKYRSRLYMRSRNSIKEYIFRLDGWVSDVINNKLSLLKYGVELLKFAIKEHKLELIDDIYKKCMTYFKEDLMNNKSFLSIITSAMPLLDEYYPEYILKYSSETNMIIDSPFYSIEHQNKNFHLYSFYQSPQIANLSKSLLLTKYQSKLFNCRNEGLVNLVDILFIIQALIILLTLPLYLATFYILSTYNFINDIYKEDLFSKIYFNTEFKIANFFKKYITTTPTITFMIPYINFVNYSRDYNWFLELIKPQSSPFTETINRNIYKTWNGEALINFKWNAYGKYYYAIIWILFMALLGCFTTAATIPQQYINEEVR